MFSDELEKISWEETTKAIYSKTEADVIRALGKSRCDVNILNRWRDSARNILRNVSDVQCLCLYLCI